MSHPVSVIVGALVTRLRSLTPANGYAIDLADRIYRGREQFFDTDAFPLASIHLTGTGVEEGVINTGARTASLAVHLITQADAQSPLDTELMLLESLERCLFPPAARGTGRETLDGSCLWAELGNVDIKPREDGGQLCELRLEVIAHYEVAP